ncbi:unnamed protein product [Leptosia nina]|uniref:Peptidase S1 domain-containing protein n=1 Tax=Leptosia nina TaxID=320188 RepID=A0AAV1JHD9_9NEOP
METVFGVTFPVKKSMAAETPQCGIDNSPISVVYEGFGKIQTYPWLGTLNYPLRDKWLSTVVVLVSKQMAVGPAIDIDKVPKIDFRAHSRVTIGTNCSGAAVRVRSYSFHPDYPKNTLSAPALIQLEYHPRMAGFRAICAPLAAFNNAQFYAMTLPNAFICAKREHNNCKSAVNLKCKAHYGALLRHSFRLNIDSVWPSYALCARSTSGKECVWRSGTVLAMKQNGHWSLVGIGVLGPGCSSPARFMEYSSYRPWVRNSLLRIGRPTVTRIADNHLVLRRSVSSVQRYGPCDPEETKAELYTDSTTIHKLPAIRVNKVSYNFTIFADVDYSCVVFRVENRKPKKKELPKIYLRRWCTSDKPLCYAMRYLQVDFYLEIYFTESITYIAKVYGKEIKILDTKRALAYFNSKKTLPKIPVLTTPKPKIASVL